MTDWSEWRAVKKPASKTISPPFNPDDWQATMPKAEPKENLIESAIMAPFRVTADALKGGYEFATKKLPGYLRQAKTEVPGFLNPLEIAKHPLNRAKQTIAGLLEGGQEANKGFRAIPEYAANRLHLIPPEWAEKIPVASDNPQWDITNAIQNTFGEPQNPGEALARGIGKNFLNLAGGSSVLESIPHLTRRTASMKLRRARNLANDRSINPLDIDPALLQDARQYLPNTRAYRNMIEKAEEGDYQSLFKLQSDLGKNSSDYASSLFSASDRAHGRAGLDTRNAILDAIHDELIGQGHNDMSGLLRAGQNDYRRFMAFRPYRNALSIAAMGLALPKNPIRDKVGKFLFQNSQ